MTKLHGPLRVLVVLSMVLGMVGTLAPAEPVAAAGETTASFSGGTGTVTADGVLYARNGGTLTLTVTTTSDAKCVEVRGNHEATQTADTAKTTWTFTFTAGVGDGPQTVEVNPYRAFNSRDKCTANQANKLTTTTASYVLDNTGPVVTGSVSPAPNAAGWHNGDVTVSWSAASSGAGVNASTITPAQTYRTDTAGQTVSGQAQDILGNLGTGSVTFRLDKTAPAIAGKTDRDPNSYTCG